MKDRRKDTLGICSMKLLKINDSLPVVIDLFSGCGGLAFGFRSAGFRIGGGIDIDEVATATASYNLSWRFGEEGCHFSRDITQIEASLFHRVTGGKNGVIVIGGPPCQAYSLIGKGKLNSLGKERNYLNDSRGRLYLDFLRIALELDARAIVMENVPEAMNYGNQNIPEEVCRILEDNGYNAKWSILNAADYGVPQLRERMFVIAIRKTEGFEPVFPAPSHRSPDGKLGIYQQRINSLLSNKYFVPPLEPDRNALPWVTVAEALSDLPVLFPTSSSKYRLYEPNVMLNYVSEPKNDYQLLMRTWTGQKLSRVTGHGFRRTPRDYPIFERMKPDDNYVVASEIAEKLFLEACEKEGITIDKQPERYYALRKKMVPPYNREKFRDKWKRLNPDKPSHTLVAHLSVDTYSHIHPWEPRGISVREAARLQSFPDDFLFQCSMGDAFKQIGNAVPPLLSYAIAQQLSTAFCGQESFLKGVQYGS